MDPLFVFSAGTRAWFEQAFPGPTPAQTLGWPAIASGEHTLIQAPTGSGKTLAAFLYGIDKLNPEPGQGLRLIYVSPLKALNYDIERNLRGPLAGLHSELRIDERAAISVSRRADAERAVACGIPGYEHVGREYYADELRVDDEPFHWRLEGNCAFATTFEYASQ